LLQKSCATAAERLEINPNEEQGGQMGRFFFIWAIFLLWTAYLEKNHGKGYVFILTKQMR
jgi:hypothetical protein